jgi:3-dehydroquinate synthase
MNQSSISFGLKALASFVEAKSYSATYVLVDENTLINCYPLLIHHLQNHHIIQTESGEANKTIQTCELIWKKLTDTNADRNSLLINLGGGVVGDIGGFAAGCYKRGVQFIQVPTTLLSMVDASVGGKTGVDFLGLKNQLGLFNQPESVIIHTPFLKTLPQRELKSGFAEVIKHYLIADGDSFRRVRNSGLKHTDDEWVTIVAKNIEIKSKIVAQDPFEKNLRKSLNFGHTIGHAVESFFIEEKGQKLLHGEAVAAGMVVESIVSTKLNLLSAQELSDVVTAVKKYFSLIALPPQIFPSLFQFMRNDKKNDKTSYNFTLLNGIGNYSIDNFVEEKMIIEALVEYNLQVV